MLARAMDLRPHRGGAARFAPMLMRDPTTAAQAMHDAKITKFNRNTYETWLAQRGERAGKKGLNSAVHEVGPESIVAVRKAYEALAGASAAADQQRQQQARPARFAATGKKAQAAAKLSAPPQQVVAAPFVRPKPAEMAFEYGATHGDLHFGGKPTKTKTKWSLEKEEAVALMEAEARKHVDRLVADSSPDGWTTWYIAADGPRKEVGKYFITPRESGVTNVFAMQVQVSLEDKHVSFHGYPDEQVLGRGIGRARNTIGS
jgi:hypothetical protein